jgi:hypothetical protein
MYNENKANQLKDVLSPMVVGIAVAIHLVILLFFCVVGSSSEKEITESSNTQENSQIAATNEVAEAVSSDIGTEKASNTENNSVVKDKKPAPVPRKTVKEEVKASTVSIKEQVKAPVKEVVKKAPAVKASPAKVKRVTNPVAKKRVKTSSDIKKGQFKKGPLKKR